MNVLAQLVCSRVRAEIFRVLFGLESNDIHLREIQRQTGFSIGTVRPDIEKLVKIGLVLRRKDGNRVYFRADPDHPLYLDLRQLVLKTVGLTNVLRSALNDSGIRIAFVFGSIAANQENPRSDIDLMVIGDIGLRKLSGLLSGQAERLGREINPHVLNPSEFRNKAKNKDHFISSVLSSRKIFVIGTEHDLEAMA